MKKVNFGSIILACMGLICYANYVYTDDLIRGVFGVIFIVISVLNWKDDSV